MSISINPIFPVIAAQGVAPEVILQPGTVIDAQVQKILANDLVRIAIANLTIEVLSEIPLQVGQTLQLAVSQTTHGIRLAVVGQGAATPVEDPLPAGPAGVTTAPLDTVTLAPDVSAALAVKPDVAVSLPRSPLTALEALAVSAAAQTAATRQGSLSPLFANLTVVAGSDGLPPKLQQAVVQLLSLRPSLDQNLTGSVVKTAFQNSGLFLEASLASRPATLAVTGSTPAPAGVPDLKAALIVFRQALSTWLGSSGAGTVPASTTTPPSPQTAQAAMAESMASLQAASLVPEIDVQEVYLPQAMLPVADDILEPRVANRIFVSPAMDAGTRTAATNAALNLLQEALQTNPKDTGQTLKVGPDNNPVLEPLLSKIAAANAPGGNDNAVAHTTMPPPPFRGALPSAQPIATPLVSSTAPSTDTVRHLLDDTDAAIARQTLLQVASLPDRIDTAGPRQDLAAPRWNFEVPFATPLGTAVAQFEISRDGGGHEVDSAKRVWRARFSLDIEPAGPVHALVSLVDDKTSVRMWVERPATASQLRAGASQLSQALSRAELKPGDIVIRDGAPPRSMHARAGHFLDRAL